VSARRPSQHGSGYRSTPNDVVVRRDGTIGSATFVRVFEAWWNAWSATLCIADPKTRDLSVVADLFNKPTVAFSPDEQTLYITDSAAFKVRGLPRESPHHVRAFTVRLGRSSSKIGCWRRHAGWPDGINKGGASITRRRVV
jgi:gluconolactonase